jgi:hypothetical protein
MFLCPIIHLLLGAKEWSKRCRTFFTTLPRLPSRAGRIINKWRFYPNGREIEIKLGKGSPNKSQPSRKEECPG